MRIGSDLAIDFANLRGVDDDPAGGLASWRELVDFSELHGALSRAEARALRAMAERDGGACAKALIQARALRDTVRQVLSAMVRRRVFEARWIADINQAIKTIQGAIDKLNPDHPRRFLWSLGWAYYERAYYAEKKDDYIKSLDALLQISNPTDAVIKNIIASKSALGWTAPAQRLAREFRARNPDYTLALEERWPYRDAKRLRRWQTHLGSSSLSGKG